MQITQKHFKHHSSLKAGLYFALPLLLFFLFLNWAPNSSLKNLIGIDPSVRVPENFVLMTGLIYFAVGALSHWVVRHPAKLTTIWLLMTTLLYLNFVLRALFAGLALQ